MVNNESQSNRPPSGGQRLGSVFVGRQRELAELTAALEEALSGQGCLFMLVGEPGIGKTRTTQEIASYAENRGAKVFWGRCYEDEGSPPYWPWVQIMRSCVQQASAEQLIAEIGRGAASIADVVPEIHDKITDLKPPPSLEPEAARFRLFDAITTFLKNAAQNQPLMLVLDDLHWADRSSLLFLEFLARELGESRILLVGCYRDTGLSRQHTLAATLAQLSRETVFRRHVLRGLGHDDLGRFIEATTGVQLSQELTGTLYAHTEGNPFFMTEVIRLLAESGELTAGYIGTPEGLRIPEGVREVIGQRLNRLSELCNQVLTTASIIGREFDFKLLIRLIEEDTEDRVLEAVEEALAARVIEEPSGTMDRYQFSHALVQETLSQELSTTRRVRLHARIATALEELYGNDADSHAAELAHHFAEAQTSSGPDKLVRYSLLAGEQALGAYAYEDALAHFERGLVAKDIPLSGTEAASDEQAAALLFGLARAQSATRAGPQLEGAFATLSRAFEYHAEAGNIAKAVAAAEFRIATPSARIPGVAELLTRALTLVPSDSHEAGRLLSRYGGIIGDTDYEGAQQAMARAITIARREGDASMEAETLTYGAIVSAQNIHWQESVSNGLQAIELATREENPLTERVSRWWTAMCLLFMGDLEGVRPHALALQDLSEKRSTSRVYAANGLAPISFLSCLEGDWKSGREYSGRGLELASLNPTLLLLLIMLEHETGESAQGDAYLERILEATRRAGLYQSLASGRACLAIPAIARITGVPDRLEIAEAVAKEILSGQSVIPVYVMYARAGLALIAVQRGDRSAAAEHYAYLLGLGQQGTMLFTVSSVDRLLGLLSHTMGNLNQAANHFEEAMAFCRKSGCRPELAWTCCDYADALSDGNATGDRTKAKALLDESLAISTELGMRPLMERVTQRLGRVQSQPSPAPAYPDGLTQREVEVLRLIAAGKTDREIAEDLIIGVRTVSTHVGNILNKTNAANRAEAASYATRHELA